MATKKIQEREEVVRAKLEECRKNLEINYKELSRLLYETWSNAYFIKWGFETLKDYAEQELGLKYRKARYYIAIAEAVARCKINWDDIESIGWTNMRHIARIMTPDNSAEWIAKARELTADQLSSQVDSFMQSGITPEGSPRIMSMQLRMDEDEATIIMDAVDRAKKILESDSIIKALEHICYEYIQSSGEGPQKTELKNVLRYVENTYGVSLVSGTAQDLTKMME